MSGRTSSPSLVRLISSIRFGIPRLLYQEVRGTPLRPDVHRISVGLHLCVVDLSIGKTIVARSRLWVGEKRYAAIPWGRSRNTDETRRSLRRNLHATNAPPTIATLQL